MINLSFSGSGFLFPIHVGALRAVEETNAKIVGYSGTSGGSIIATMAAIGLSSETMMEIVQDLRFTDFIKFDASALLRSSFCLGKEVEKWLKFVIDPNLTFSDLDIPLYIVATDINQNEGYVLCKESCPDMPLWLAVRASLSLPFIYTPVHYEGRVLMDGALYTNTPIEVFKGSEHKTLGFQITSKDTRNYFNEIRWIPDIAMRVLSMVMNNMDRLHYRLSELDPLSEMVFIDKGSYSALDSKLTDKDVAKLHNMGYLACKTKADAFVSS
jgi:NTE family protein